MGGPPPQDVPSPPPLVESVPVVGDLHLMTLCKVIVASVGKGP